MPKSYKIFTEEERSMAASSLAELQVEDQCRWKINALEVWRNEPHLS